MRDVNGQPIKVGDKVKLKKPKERYVIGPGNPAVGTEWETHGTFVGGNKVLWFNGSSNSYGDRELMNLNDQCVSIWEY